VSGEAGPHGRTSHYGLRGDPRRGAADAAPTAPHATAPTQRDKSGPARFWDPWHVRIVLFATLIGSCAAHLAGFTPWRFRANLDTGIEGKDVVGELTIPVDLEQEEEPAPPQPETTAPPDTPGPNARDASAPRPKDAGSDADDLAMQLADAAAQVQLLAILEGGAPAADASSDGGDLDGGLVAAAGDGGGPPGGGPRDPNGLVGAKAINTGPQNILLSVNMAPIRAHPLAPRIGAVLVVLPQWRDFLKGQTQIDPIKETDWIFLYGPSLLHTDRDAVLVHYNASDAAIDTIVDGIAKRSNDRKEEGGPFGPYDAGVPGVKATTGRADNATRVFLRPTSHLLVIAPPKHANDAAKAYAKSPRGPVGKEAMHLTVRDPSKQVAIPNLKFDAHLKEIRLWIIPDAGGGADIYADGDVDDESFAPQIATDLTKVLSDLNNLGVQLGPFKVTVSSTTKHVLDNAQVTSEGKRINLHIKASPEQLDAVLRAVESSPLTQP
jgi:hypothetical protein